MNDLRYRGFTGYLGLALIAVALVLGAGGVWLLIVGGTAYYVAIAIGLLLTGLLLLMRSPWALWTFAALLVATLVWALGEAGLDWWPLAARLDVFFVIGAVLLLPWSTRSLGTRPASASTGDAARRPISARHGGGLALALALGATALVSVASWFNDAHDVAGSLPPSQGAMTSAGEAIRGVPPGEWHAYGRTGFGQRYSPLKEIDVGNVSKLAVAWHFETGDLRGQPGDPVETTDEVTPLKIGDRLFLCTPHQDVIALNATTGAQVWRYKARTVRRDPSLRRRQRCACLELGFRQS